MSALPSALAACRTAAMTGPFVNEGQHYRFGRRFFSLTTIAAARAEGVEITVAMPKQRKIGLRVTVDDREMQSIRSIAENDDRSIADMVRQLVKEAIKARAERERP